MSIAKIGPKEIFFYRGGKKNAASFNKLVRDVAFFCMIDSTSSIERFQEFIKKKKRGEFCNGYLCQSNILMVASLNANEGLVREIVHRSDKKLLNMRDNTGKTALFYATMSWCRPIEKVIACVQLLLAGETNVNACSGMIRKPSRVDAALNESKFFGSNVLGYCVQKMSATPGSLTECESERFKKLILIFVASRATCYIRGLGMISSDEIDQVDAKRARPVALLKEAKDNWSKVKLLFLGKKDAASIFSTLPDDLICCLFQKIVHLTY